MKEAQPIAVYCTTQKRCVLLFSSVSRSDKYVFAPLKYSVSRSRYLIQNKGKTEKNVFQKMLAFRVANTQQIAMLGDSDIVILDKDFAREVVDSTIKLTANY